MVHQIMLFSRCMASPHTHTHHWTRSLAVSFLLVPLSAQGEKIGGTLFAVWKTMLPHMRVWSLNAWDSLVTSLVLQGMAYSALTTPRSRGETLRSEGAALAPKQAPNAQIQPATLLKVMVLRMKIRFLVFLKRLKLKELKIGSHLLGL